MESLSTIESLLLAQAVYEHGADAWQTVSNVLSNHPALVHRPDIFTPQFCHQIYLRLMNDASLECSDANNAPHALLNLTLAQHHYAARLLHLRDLIAVEEARFKSLVTEIGQIRSGAWNDKIKAKLVGTDDTSPHDVPVDAPLPPPPEPAETPHPQEPQPTTSDVTPTDDQPTSTQTPDDERPQVVEEAPQTANTPVDIQIAEAIPVDETVPEPTLADVPDISEASPPEPAQMEVEEHVVPQDPEQKPDPKAQEREGKRKVADSDSLDDNLREKKRPRDESTPPDLEDQAYSRPRSTANGEQTNQQTPPSVPNKRFQAVIGMLHSQISQHRNGNIFHNPIKNSEAPDYHDIIKRPMDLKSIKAKVKDGIISNSLEFQRDVYLMFANAMMYNRPGSDIYHMAEEMMLESEVHINTFRQTEGFIRSTRS